MQWTSRVHENLWPTAIQLARVVHCVANDWGLASGCKQRTETTEETEGRDKEIVTSQTFFVAIVHPFIAPKAHNGVQFAGMERQLRIVHWMSRWVHAIDVVNNILIRFYRFLPHSLFPRTLVNPTCGTIYVALDSMINLKLTVPVGMESKTGPFCLPQTNSNSSKLELYRNNLCNHKWRSSHSWSIRRPWSSTKLDFEWCTRTRVHGRCRNRNCGAGAICYSGRQCMSGGRFRSRFVERCSSNATSAITATE